MTDTTDPNDPRWMAFVAWAQRRWGKEAWHHTINTRGEWDAWNGALEQQAAQIEAMRAALEWYADEARSCEKNSKVGNYYAGDAILASVTVLALDGGKRADAALRQEGPKP